MLIRVLICAIVTIFQVHASTTTTLQQLFVANFYTHYQEGKCGLNILGLITRAQEQGLDVSNAHIIEITNKGFSVFGLVNVEYARGAGRLNPNPDSGFRNLPGERNWYHHVVLELNGQIYDFDFGNTPAVTTVSDYFEKMFLEEKTKDQGGDFYVGRDEKQKNYKLVIRKWTEVAAAQRDRRPSPPGEEYSLGEFIQLF